MLAGHREVSFTFCLHCLGGALPWGSRPLVGSMLWDRASEDRLSIPV